LWFTTHKQSSTATNGRSTRHRQVGLLIEHVGPLCPRILATPLGRGDGVAEQATRRALFSPVTIHEHSC
jgi:hypothetical protein